MGNCKCDIAIENNQIGDLIGSHTINVEIYEWIPNQCVHSISDKNKFNRLGNKCVHSMSDKNS